MSPDSLPKKRSLAHSWTAGLRASNAVHRAIRAGQLTRPDTCELCGVKPLPIVHDHRDKKARYRTAINAHHWRGYAYPLDVWFICRDCNQKLKGEKYHNGSVTKEQARALVCPPPSPKIYTRPAIIRISRRCLATVPGKEKRCQLRTTTGYYCHMHKVKEPTMVIKLRTFLANLQDEGCEVPSMTELADEIGVSRPHMYKIAAGKTDYKISALAGIISAMRKRGFKMDINDLLEYREN